MDNDKTQTYKIKTKKNKKVHKHPRIRKTIKITLITIILLLIIGAGILFGWGYQVLKDARLSTEDLSIKYQNSIVKDINGNTIATLSGDENREIVSLDDMSKYLPVAFVSIEDERFYQHNGVDLKRTAGATIQYVLHKGSSAYGGSTITQQLVKNLTNEKEDTWQRKVTEMARAYYLEKQMSKDQILELYLNLIFLGGNNVCGVEVASNLYFDKSAKDLDLAECAFLAGINHSPNAYDPFSGNDIEKIRLRTITVLNKMKELGKINDDEYNSAVEETNNGLAFKQGTIVQTKYSYHTDAAIEQIISELMAEHDWTHDYAKLYLSSGGFTIYTTENPEIQKAMEEEFAKTKYQIPSKKNPGATSEAAMVLIDQKTGYVLATVGKLGEKTDAFGFNRATQNTKQAGSSFKPLAVLSPGIDNGIITAASLFNDTPTTFGNYHPKDYNTPRGLVTVRQAIATSQNIPMVKAMQMITPAKSIEFLQSVGINVSPDKDNGLALALGGLTYGTNPLEMAGAYNAIANGGVYIEPTFYTKVVDSNGNVVKEAKQEKRTVMSEAAAFVVQEIITEPVKASNGTATYCAIPGMSVAAKTGTTDDDYDRWLCGFTPYYTAACWFGYDQNETVYFSGNPAGLIWSSVMKTVSQGLPGKTFEENIPDGVTTAPIYKDTGLLAADNYNGSRVITEYFVKGTVPSQERKDYIQVNICADTGMIATEYCPNVITKTYLVSGLKDAAGYPIPDSEDTMPANLGTCTLHTGPPASSPPADASIPSVGYPTIILNGSSSMSIETGQTFTDPRSKGY